MKDDLLKVEKMSQGFKLILTPAAKEEFGDITFLNLPKVGTKINQGDSFAEIEAEKAVNELVSPVTGLVEKMNEKALEDPSILNTAENPWLVEISFAE